MWWHDAVKPWWFELIQSGSVVVDVGAHIGDTVAAFAEKVGPTGHVYAIEPGPKLFVHLVERTHTLTHVDAYRLAISDENRKHRTVVHWGDFTLLDWDAPSAKNWEHISHPAQDIALKEVFMVSFITLDEFVAWFVDKKIDWLKIDVDGGEGSVIRGAMKVLKEHHPSILIEIGYETMARLYDHPLELLTRLEGLGYRFWDPYERVQYTLEGVLHHIHRNGFNGANDFVCLHTTREN